MIEWHRYILISEYFFVIIMYLNFLFVLEFSVFCFLFFYIFLPTFTEVYIFGFIESFLVFTPYTVTIQWHVEIKLIFMFGISSSGYKRPRQKEMYIYFFVDGKRVRLKGHSAHIPFSHAYKHSKKKYIYMYIYIYLQSVGRSREKKNNISQQRLIAHTIRLFVALYHIHTWTIYVTV